MVWWQAPKDQDDLAFLAEKNCTTVSHELTHELLRQNGKKNYVDTVHDVWTKHTFANLSFEKYDKDFKKTNTNPLFLTLDTSSLEK